MYPTLLSSPLHLPTPIVSLSITSPIISSSHLLHHCCRHSEPMHHHYITTGVVVAEEERVGVSKRISCRARAHVWRDQIIRATKPETLVPQVKREPEVSCPSCWRRGRERSGSGKMLFRGGITRSSSNFHWAQLRRSLSSSSLPPFFTCSLSVFSPFCRRPFVMRGTRPLPPQLQLLLLCAFLVLLPPSSAQPLSCQEVRTVFHSLHPGSKWVPENPVSGNPPQLLSCTSVDAPRSIQKLFPPL